MNKIGIHVVLCRLAAWPYVLDALMWLAWAVIAVVIIVAWF